MDKKKRIQQLKEDVYKANLALVEHHLVKLTWGNVSGIDRELGIIVIKPSGVPYETMSSDDMVVTDLEGIPLDLSSLKPSSDLKTHVYLYKNFEEINSVTHTHAKWSVVWASIAKDIPILNTTHADVFYGSIPCARDLTQIEIDEDYERNTGAIIVETLKERNIRYTEVPAIITSHHGPFTWGKTIKEAVENAITLDEVADIAYHAQLLDPNIQSIPDSVKEKHYQRKHGKNAYYGQK